MNDGSGIEVTPDSLMIALDRIKGKAKLDHYGISVGAVKIAAIAQPSIVASFLSLVVASTAIMSSIVVKGRVFGKESSTTPATSLRSILPLPAVMQILDVLIPSTLESHVRTLLPCVPECFIGAVPGTQCLDVAHGLQSVIEKGLDNFGAAAVAQSDIEKYYDSPSYPAHHEVVDNTWGACPSCCLCCQASDVSNSRSESWYLRSQNWW